MRLLTAAILFICLSVPPANAAEKIAADGITSKEILEASLKGSILPELIRDWQISLPNGQVVISDISIDFMFPQSAQQALDQEYATQRSFKDGKFAPKEYAKIDFENLMFGNPNGSQDFVLTQGHIIPKDVVFAALKVRKGLRVPSVSCSQPLNVILESARFIHETFRTTKNHSKAFLKKYPKAVAVIELTLPAMSSDGNTAAVYYTALRPGLGGRGQFIMLQKDNSSWTIKWSHGVWFE